LWACIWLISFPSSFFPRGVNVPGTALHHFQQDIGRARAIVAHANTLPPGSPVEHLLRSDLWRSVWSCETHFGVSVLSALAISACARRSI
jgi:hypothetical protein